MRRLIVICLACLSALCMMAMRRGATPAMLRDTVTQSMGDTISKAQPDTIAKADTSVWRNDNWADLQYEEDAKYLNDSIDSVSVANKIDSAMTVTLKPKTFTPDPIRAQWLAMVLPGAGQIYNHKYWKLPIFYGGFLGCIYAFSWNSQMLRDYSQAYLDIMDDDPNTKSYEKMLPIGYDISGKEERFKTTFKNKKNYFRKYRDMSIFAFAGVYLLSIIDAYVDAELSSFDISRDLSLHWEPTTINSDTKLQRQLGYRSYGVLCSLHF